MTTSFDYSALKTPGHWVKALRISSFLFAGFLAQGSLAAQTVTLGFDDIPAGTAVTTQYQSQGIIISGAQVVQAGAIGASPKSSPNVALSSEGLMVFAINSSILANVQSASVYVSGAAGVGIYAYDAAGNLLDSEEMSVNGSNILLTVNSPGAPIAQIAIHDGGSSFFVDDVSFVNTVTTTDPGDGDGDDNPKPGHSCRDHAKRSYENIGKMAENAFRHAKQMIAKDRARLMARLADFESRRQKGAKARDLQNLVNDIKNDLNDCIKPAQAQSIMNALSEINSRLKNNKRK